MSASDHLQDKQFDDSAYCIRCGREDLPSSQLCKRSEDAPVVDHGANRDPGDARFEGRCQRCCGHNHG